MKTILVTGGTGSLGSVVVPRLEREYRCVLIRRGEHAETIARASAPVYALVNLAGGFAAGSVAESDEAAWMSMIQSNVLAFVNAARGAIPHMEKGGRIVAISSIASLMKPAGIAAYAVSKSALNTAVEILAKELKPRGITANALLPDTLKSGSASGVPLENVADAIAFLLSDAAANINGSLIPMSI